MQLKPDCVRDTLLQLEKMLTVNCHEGNFNGITLYLLTQEMQKEHPSYTEEDIWYTIYNLKEIHYIDGAFQSAGRDKMYVCNIENIAWQGHMFLNTIRPKTIWEATKSKAKQIGGMSIHSLNIISSAIMQGLASNPDFIQSIIDLMK